MDHDYNPEIHLENKINFYKYINKFFNFPTNRFLFSRTMTIYLGNLLKILTFML